MRNSQETETVPKLDRSTDWTQCEPEKKPEFKVGRFQVSHSDDKGARAVTQPTPTRHSPPPQPQNQSESSSETTSSSSSISSTTSSSSSSSSGHSQVGVASQTNQNTDEKKEGEESEEGHSGNSQSNHSRHQTYVSSDESESENEDGGMWAELRQLRDRHLAQVHELQANQKKEIEQLYVRMGKTPPAGIVAPAAILNQRQRRLSKSGQYRRNSQQAPPTGIMRRGYVSGSSSGSLERVKGVTFAPDATTMDT
ncbi:hypothetical protein WMY93_014106 [Mugilogobius chulae]|uniref:Uncharacterized protein n=1 Tax=Mugilogobius chulae TaxID=88201 RepID=A0AAW0NU16_9GOBI